MITLYHGDCLEEMKKIPDSSIDCVICDLPYGSLKQVIADGWKENESDVSWDSIIDTEKLFNEYDRVLRHNGSLILFHKEPLTTQLRIHRNKNIQLSHTYVWKKDNFSNPYICNVSPLSVCENVDVYYKKYEQNCDMEYDKYRKRILCSIGESKKDIISKCGQGVDHFFRDRTKQFISESSYNSLISEFGIDKFDFFLTWNDLKSIINKCSRTFNVPSGVKYITDFLDFPKDKDSIHPVQKPLALIIYLMKIYSNLDDIVLDNCMGSGTTGIVCSKMNRTFVGCELDADMFNIAKQRIENQEKISKSRLF